MQHLIQNLTPHTQSCQRKDRPLTLYCDCRQHDPKLVKKYGWLYDKEKGPRLNWCQELTIHKFSYMCPTTYSATVVHEKTKESRGIRVFFINHWVIEWNGRGYYIYIQSLNYQTDWRDRDIHLRVERQLSEQEFNNQCRAYLLIHYGITYPNEAYMICVETQTENVQPKVTDQQDAETQTEQMKKPVNRRPICYRKRVCF